MAPVYIYIAIDVANGFIQFCRSLFIYKLKFDPIICVGVGLILYGLDFIITYSTVSIGHLLLRFYLRQCDLFLLKDLLHIFQ